MSRSAVVYLVLTAAFLFILSISRAPRATRHHRTRRLFHAGFDPIFNEIERQVEEKGLFHPDAFYDKFDKYLKNPHSDKSDGLVTIMDDIFGKNGGLNVTERLVYLFPLLDRNPKDGVISFTELEVWMHKQALERLVYETEREIERHDRDENGEITLYEYLNYFPNQEIDWSNMQKEKPGWWREKFRIADLDGNGSLNSTEFNHFLHPEDSPNPKLHLWLLKEKLRDFDKNNDGKLNLQEFRNEAHKLHGLFESSETGKHKHPLDDLSKTEQKFRELDTNKDDFLTAEELMPILEYLYPGGELAHSSFQTKQLMKESDDDNDGNLTLQEMLNHYQAFYSAVSEEEEYIDDDDDDYFNDYDHDEFR